VVVELLLLLSLLLFDLLVEFFLGRVLFGLFLVSLSDDLNEFERDKEGGAGSLVTVTFVFVYGIYRLSEGDDEDLVCCVTIEVKFFGG